MSLSILQLALVLSGLFFLLAVYLFSHPYHILRGIVFLLRHTLIRLKIDGVENIPASGPVLLVSNHISLIDLLLLQTASKRPLHFMMAERVFRHLPFKALLRCLGLLVVPGARSPKAMQAFFHRTRLELRKGNALCLFPEGGISGSGGLMRFRSSVTPFLPTGGQVTVIPVRIGMLRGRLLTIADGTFRLKLPSRLPVDFNIRIGKPIPPTLSAYQLRQVISELGAEAEMGPQPDELPLHTAFLLHAKLHPFRATYIDADTGGVSNFQILVRSAVMSRLIRNLDCGESGYVGVLLPNCTILASLMFGVLFSDRTPAVINFSAGREVALEAARRAGITRILTSRKFLVKLGWEPSPEMCFLEEVARTVSPGLKRRAILKCLLLPRRMLARKLAPLSAFNSQREAVLLFSSGSTGAPKAVMLTHRNVCCDLWSFWRVIDWSSKDKLAGNLPLFHAYGFTVCFSFSAMAGTPVVYVKNPLEATALVEAIARYGLTILTATPTFLQNYLRKAQPEQLRSLRLTITGAEKLRPELAKKYREMTGRDVIEGYGCTELSPIVTINLCNSIFKLGKHADHPGSIGIALPGIHIRTVHPETGIELGPNQSGRLQVKGGLVMRGYLNDARQTAKVIQNGYYDTGDIAKIDQEGYVYITGRASRFSKIGGEMVPHESIEQCISRLRESEEREVAVTGRTDPRRGERLIVFYTPEDFSPADVIAAMRRDKLPNLWIPKPEDFIRIAELPMLGSGKLDLKHLKELAEKL